MESLTITHPTLEQIPGYISGSQSWRRYRFGRTRLRDAYRQLLLHQQCESLQFCELGLSSGLAGSQQCTPSVLGSWRPQMPEIEQGRNSKSSQDSGAVVLTHTIYTCRLPAGEGLGQQQSQTHQIEPIIGLILNMRSQQEVTLKARKVQCPISQPEAHDNLLVVRKSWKCWFLYKGS